MNVFYVESCKRLFWWKWWRWLL